ncbi:MAG: hypothetical protein AAFZ15_18575 [Bacteroidota bacterium]
MAASSITILLKAQGNPPYLQQVSSLVVGNMVDPVTGQFWYQPPAANPWIWENTGTNARSFGLMANYKLDGVEKTAFSKVVIDPTTMAEGEHHVEVTLCTAAVGGSVDNLILRFKDVSVDGVPNGPGATINEWGTDKPQPPSEFYDCP